MTTLVKEFQIRFSDIPYSHQYNTRHQNDPKIPIHKTKIYSNSFLVKGPTYWLELNNNQKSKKSIKSFVKMYKKSVINH